ncbi:uncharacterized protein LOC131684006 [Topomyia yanbarensis]|uniref:uncharacterized protein LOC131684006 n=1 Tax=Topomyia yanbarensis TaxID=2498891 RepID=UPI00273BC20A|nr:uncharacterized protein LOC131684006 [Topomyia yanbarensis]
MTNYEYTCSCELKSHIYLDILETTKLDKALDQLIDSAWDDDDEESDELLVSFISTAKKETTFISKENLVDVLNSSQHQKINGSANIILTDLNKNESCNCRAVSRRLSVLLSWGLAELKFSDVPNEQRLLEVLGHIQPFAKSFSTDNSLKGFLQQIWNYAIETGKSSIVSKLVTIEPSKIDQLIENLLNIDSMDFDFLSENTDFKILASIVCVPEVFRRVSLCLAEKQMNSSSDKIQTLVNVILKTVKAALPKRQYLNLYSPKLSTIAAILNEAINPDDPLVLSLLTEVKNSCYVDFVVLVTHFSLFINLK